MRNSTTGSILGVAVMAVVFAAGASAHNGRSATRQATPAPASKPTAAAPIGMVQDWTNEHVMFRNVETPEEAKAKGRYERWKRLYRDPRFSLALTEKLEAQAYAASRKTANGRPKPNPIPGPSPSPSPSSDAENGVHRDWSNVLGGGADGRGGNGSAGTYPAKYNFNILAAPSCANDFVVYATNAAGATASGGTSETWTITFTGNPTAGQTVTIGGTAPRQVTLIASSVGNSGLYFQFTGNNTTNATNLRDAINRWTGQTGLSATSAAGVVTITSLTLENLPDGDVAEGLTNGALGRTGGTDGTPGQPSIIAFNKLYNGYCAAGGADTGPDRANDNAPDVYWAYNTGGTVRTSPTLSYYDGAKQVAFVQSNGSNQAELVLLKWKTGAGNGSASAPATPTTAVSAADYRDPDGNANGCTSTAACMYKIAFNGAPNVTYSSPFIDYSANIAYVGDDAGRLHKFSGIFAGDPAEVTTGGFPSTVSAGNALSPPVYDFAGNVYVGSASAGAGSGGMIHKVNATNGTFISSAKVTANNATGFRATPMIDLKASVVYALTANDGTNRAVYQFPLSFTAGATGSKVSVGLGTTNLAGDAQYIGRFDSAYRSSANSTGNLYVCGSLPGDDTSVAMWKIPITAGVMGAPVQGKTLSDTQSLCSPVSLISNSGNQYLYAAVPAGGNAQWCNGACLYMFNLNGLDAGVSEQWSFTFNNSQVNGGGSFIVDTITFNAVSDGNLANNSTNCTGAGGNFDIYANGGANTDGGRLRGCTSQVAGYTTTGAGATVIITRNLPGNVADNLVREGNDMDQFSENLGSHIQGVAPSSTTWATTNVPAAGLNVIGGIGGIVLDNISTLPGTSQIYFSNLGTPGSIPGNAIQTSQSGLQ